MRFEVKLSLKTIRTAALWLLTVVLAAGGGYFWATYKVDLDFSQIKPRVSVYNKSMPQDFSDVDFSLFWEVWDRLEQTYLEPEKLNSREMVYGAIEGMVASAGDPYTVFLPPKDNQQAKEDLNGAFEGVGIQLGYKKETVAVIAPLEGMPAKAAGVRAGDIIVNIKDDKKGIDTDTMGMTLQEAVDIIRGPKGTPVILTLLRGEQRPFEVSIVRETIVVPSVELSYLDNSQTASISGVLESGGQLAHLKLYRFGERTQGEWDKAVSDIVLRQAQVKGVILDLRNNPGGFLQGSIDLSSEFIGDGVVVQQQGRWTTETYSVSKKGKLIGEPVVVLVNQGSASASEIMAGALRDRIGAKLVGVRTFGKGTVQDALDLRQNAGLHVTVARWLLPEGDWIHEDGLEPDVEVELSEDGSEDTQLIEAVRQF